MNVFSFIDSRERGREGEREENIDVRGKHGSFASCLLPNQGLNPQSRHVPLPGIKPAIFWFVEQRPMEPHLPGQKFLKKNFFNH